MAQSVLLMSEVDSYCGRVEINHPITNSRSPEQLMWPLNVALAVLSLIPSKQALVAVPREHQAQFSMDSILEAAWPVLHPLVAASSKKCEVVKSYLGVTYDQIQEKKVPDFYASLNLDLISRTGIVKYDFDNTVSKVLDPSKPLVVLIHGFLESSEGLMVQTIATELLKKGNITILALDGRDVLTMEYLRSSTYVRFMGEKLGSIISDLVAAGHSSSSLTLVGHSLGAHIAGIAGKTAARAGTPVGHIVGLDPAGPCFSAANDGARLGPGDASYVQVVHSNAGVLGIKEPAGDKDFYLNGGMSQPGCILATCDHTRAWEVFAETINSPQNFPARQCNNWTVFKAGGCSGGALAYMGWRSTADSGPRGTYFLATAGEPPFGLRAAGSG